MATNECSHSFGCVAPMKANSSAGSSPTVGVEVLGVGPEVAPRSHQGVLNGVLELLLVDAHAVLRSGASPVTTDAIRAARC